MADMPTVDSGYNYISHGSAAEVPATEGLLDFVDQPFFFEDHFTDTKYTSLKQPVMDPLMDGKIDPAVGGGIFDPRQQRLELETHFQTNFWLTPQASNQMPMAFQPVSMANQLPPVGAEYQIQSGMDSIASPYSPESEGSFDDTGDTSQFQLRLPSDLDLKGPIQKLTEEQLVSLSARDLNTICRDLPEDVVKQLKKRRRTLKNRGYAYNSRVRRVSQKNQLEKERDELQKQIAQLQDKVKHLEREADSWKRKAQSLERGEMSR